MFKCKNVCPALFLVFMWQISDIDCIQLQEEEALLNEMEVTGQAFEDMQEQNIRLLQQLREKDDANFKLMSEVSISIEDWIQIHFH